MQQIVVENGTVSPTKELKHAYDDPKTNVEHKEKNYYQQIQQNCGGSRKTSCIRNEKWVEDKSGNNKKKYHHMPPKNSQH